MERWSVSSAPGLLGSRRDRLWRRARCALPAALGGCSALHLMRSGCLSHPCAPAARSHSPSNTPARARNAHDLAGPRTRWNAQTRSAPTRWPLPERSQRAWAGRACCWRHPPEARTLSAARGDPRPGLEREGPQILLAFPPTTRRAFVLPLRLKASPPSRLSRPSIRPA